MGCQIHAIGKAIRPLFADSVTISLFIRSSWVRILLHVMVNLQTALKTAASN